MHTATIDNRIYEYGKDSAGSYLNALYNASKRVGNAITCGRIERPYWQLPEVQKKWMRDLGFTPVKIEQGELK